MQWAKNKHTGFTIVELLIVVVVIAILAAITIVAYSGIQQQARDSVRKSDAAAIAKTLKLWSYNTSKSFSEMNYGNGGLSANGWFDGEYSGTPSVRSVLRSGGFSGVQNMDDPMRSESNPARWRYMISPCTGVTGDNRRVILVELEQAPDQTILQQLSAYGCDSTFLTTYPSVYKVNYAVMADAR
jgi:prepilin-type N-terminal cleavage/methylation domain-containing protein